MRDFLLDMNSNTYDTGLTLGLRPANERCRYKVTPSLIGWTQAYRASAAMAASDKLVLNFLEEVSQLPLLLQCTRMI